MKRAHSISLLKLICCLCIFAFHYLTNFSQFETDIYFSSFPVVFIFSFLSGFLYGSKEIKDGKSWIKKNLFKLAFPAIIYMVVFSLIEILVGMFRYNFDWNLVFSNFAPVPYNGKGNNFIFGNLWFLAELAICYLFTPLLAGLLRKKYSKKVSIILWIVFAGFCLAEILCNFFCAIMTIYIIAYILGFFFFEKITFSSEKHLCIYGVILLLTIGAYVGWYLYMPGHYNDANAIYFNTPFRLFKFLLNGVEAIGTVIVVLRLFRWMNKYDIKLFKITDKYTFPFYMVHQPFMVGTLCFYEYLNPHEWYIPILIVMACIAAFGVTWLSDFLQKKINDHKLAKQPA